MSSTSLEENADGTWRIVANPDLEGTFFQDLRDDGPEWTVADGMREDGARYFFSTWHLVPDLVEEIAELRRRLVRAFEWLEPWQKQEIRAMLVDEPTEADIAMAKVAMALDKLADATGGSKPDPAKQDVADDSLGF